MLTNKGVSLIKRWEGCRLSSYLCQAGKWTVGWGTTSAAGFGKITKGMTISQELADEWLIASLSKYEDGVVATLKRSPTPHQKDAMVALAYNIGVPAFSRSSVVRRFNAGDFAGAADAFLMWNKVRQGGRLVPSKGLTNRRRDERTLFLSNEPAVVPPIPPKAETPVAQTPKPVAPTWWQRLINFIFN